VDLLEYTSPEEIRAFLGVSDDEIEDVTILLPVYSTNLEAELRELNTSVITTYQVVHAKAPVDRTSAEEWFHSVMSMFAANSVARQLCTSLPLFAPREIGDGKAHATRWSQDPFLETIRMVKEQYETNRRRLESAYASAVTTTTTSTRRVYMARTSSIDPVTGA
jgi:hypothetical protein